MKPLESLESTQVKLQGDRPSPKNPRGSQSNLRIPRRELRKLRVAQYVLKIAHLGILIEPRAWTPRLRSPTPIMHGS